uniref:Uncharacterized protein n=1 Tax=Molossus molossus TaxID=27622 RepID=A0A7J8J7Z0_MOLMO|nr:hypothetical protein HJG59_009667 [Molossus molossus]
MNPPEEIFQVVASPSQPSFSEVKILDPINGNDDCTSPPERELQQPCSHENTQQEKQEEISASDPLKEKTSIENMRQKTFTYMTPYQGQKNGKISSYDTYQKKCKCHYCQTQKEAISGNPDEQHPLSWKSLVEGFNPLNLHPDTTQACSVQGKLPQDSEREKSHQMRMKKSKIPLRIIK